jgi:hypothetical protein
MLWVLLALGVAQLTPLIQPQRIELVCSGGGGMKLLVGNDDGSTSSTHLVNCVLCPQASAPPPTLPVFSALAAEAGAAEPIEHLAARTVRLSAPPLPARGPPHMVA